MARDDVRTYTYAGPPREIEISIERRGSFYPTSTSTALLRAMADDALREKTGGFEGRDVLVLGCGTGPEVFHAANLGARKVVGCDVIEDAVEDARANLARMRALDPPQFTDDQVIEFYAGDLWDALPAGSGPFDIITGDVSGAARPLGEVAGWGNGGEWGIELPERMLRTLDGHLKPGGLFFLPTGTIQYERGLVDTAELVFGGKAIMEWGPFSLPLPQAISDSPDVRRLYDMGVLEFERPRPHRFRWSLTIRCYQLQARAAGDGDDDGADVVTLTDG